MQWPATVPSPRSSSNCPRALPRFASRARTGNWWGVFSTRTLSRLSGASRPARRQVRIRTRLLMTHSDTRATLAELFTTLGITPITIEHPPVHTVDEAMQYWAGLEGVHTK